MKYSDLTMKLSDERIAIYSNKEQGYYFAQTRNINSDYFRGWFIFDTKIIEDYAILNDNNIPLDKSKIISEVTPHKIKKSSDDIICEDILFDFEDALLININSKKFFSFVPMFPPELKYKVSIDSDNNMIIIQYENKFIIIKSLKNLKFEYITQDIENLSKNRYQIIFKINVQAGKNNFLFVHGNNKNETVKKCQHIFLNRDKYIQQKQKRLEKIIYRANINTDDEIYNKALNWVLINTDNLVMNKVGKGIFAGFPWFNNYWGRDTFISFPGTVLVTGNFKEAKEILYSFLSFQCLDEHSENYGRVPNRVNSKNDIIYNTADGTAWAIIQVCNYLKYTNDKKFAKKIFKHIECAIKGNLMRCDKNYFLKHKDAETWMDAQIDGRIAYTPRGERANDIQVLWYMQLIDGAIIAKLLGYEKLSEEWSSIAEALKNNFEKYFLNKNETLYDHLNEDNSGDTQIRPNEIFAVSIPEKYFLNEKILFNIVEEVTEKLTYEYGVASLYQNDANFHPYHHNPLYHYDEAYHNGTVWQWLAGAVITSLVKFGNSNLSFLLTKNMCNQILNMGAVGALAELIDAIPDETGNIHLSGTFSQAWSNAEFLRNFFQDYAGFKPNLLNKELTLNPNIPDKLKKISFNGYIGKSLLKISYKKNNDEFDCEINPIKLKDKFSIKFNYNNNYKFLIKNIISKKYRISIKEGTVILNGKKIKFEKEIKNYKNLKFQKPKIIKELKLGTNRF